MLCNLITCLTQIYPTLHTHTYMHTHMHTLYQSLKCGWLVIISSGVGHHQWSSSRNVQYSLTISVCVCMYVVLCIRMHECVGVCQAFK